MPPTLPFRSRCWNNVDLFWCHVRVCWCHFGNFGVIWGANWSPKSVLTYRRTWWASLGIKGPLESTRVPFRVILGSCWGHLGCRNAKFEHEVGLEQPGRPPGFPKGSQGVPWEPNGAIWSIWESFWGKRTTVKWHHDINPGSKRRGNGEEARGTKKGKGKQTGDKQRGHRRGKQGAKRRGEGERGKRYEKRAANRGTKRGNRGGARIRHNTRRRRQRRS